MAQSRCCFSSPAYSPSPAQLPDIEAKCSHLARILDCEAVILPTASASAGDRCWHSLQSRTDELSEIAQADWWWATRGGYSCQELVPDLLAHPGELPAFIGFSDCTVIHCCYAVRNWPAGIYAAMPLTSQGPRAQQSLKELHADTCKLSCEGVRPLTEGSCEGISFAACLRMLAAVVGTPAMPNLADVVLFLEDIDERPYAVDRCLQQLHQAGHLRDLKGLIFGTFPYDRPDQTEEPEMLSICQQWAHRLAIPSCFGLPFGHVTDPLSIPQRRHCRLQTGNDVSITFYKKST